MSEEEQAKHIANLISNIIDLEHEIERKDKVINDLLSKISDLEFEVERLNKETKRLREEYVILQNASDEVEENKDEEIERLNNIINKLEHHLYQEWLEWKDSDCESIYSRAGEDKAIYDYLQELKGEIKSDNII